MERNKDHVYTVYEELTEWFDEHRNKELLMEASYLKLIQEHIPHQGSILDVGCGTGEPLASFFIHKGYHLTGIDGSKNMVALCQKRFPQAQWQVADMRYLTLKQSFDLVLAWHSFFHLSPEEQPATLELLASFVKPQGLLVFTSGPEYGEVWGNNGGHDLYHASLSAETYQNLLEKNHFKVLAYKANDPECGDATVWVAKKEIRL